MESQELHDVLVLIEESLSELEYRLGSLYALAQVNRHQFLVRASRDVARAAAMLAPLEERRRVLVERICEAERLPSMIRLSALAGHAEELWREPLMELSDRLTERLERITTLQGEVRGACRSQLSILDSALALIGGGQGSYTAAGSMYTARAGVLSEAL